MTFDEYWNDVVQKQYPHYYSSDRIASENDAWKEYEDATNPQDKQKILAEIKRLNHLIANEIVDNMIDDHIKKYYNE